MKNIGIVAHSAEGGALCFVTACREGARNLGSHMHPTIIMSAVPMGLSMPGWRDSDHDAIAKHLKAGVECVAAGGADFYICPDNTAHIVLDEIAASLPIPGLHIGEVVCMEISRNGWKKVGLLGTEWTMAGPVYSKLLANLGYELQVPKKSIRKQLDDAIFNELCQGIFKKRTTDLFIGAIDTLKLEEAECVVLGCTEIPLIVTSANSPLPILDSTRLLARYAVLEAINERPFKSKGGWIELN